MITEKVLHRAPIYY